MKFIKPHLPLIFIVIAIAILIHQVLFAGVLFQIDDLHHETFVLMLIFAGLVLLMLRKRITFQLPSGAVLSVVLVILGFYLVIDGAGSIWYYSDQPVIPDHFFRGIRMVVGFILIYFGVSRR